MATNPLDRKWTAEEYLAYDDASDIRHEFLNGKLIAKIYETSNHSIIVSNTSAILWQLARKNACRARL